MINKTVPSRSSSIDIHIGEWNLDWSGDIKCFQNFNTVWGASVIGHALSGGAILLQYADKNGVLGAMFEANNATLKTSRDDPMPIYFALGMYTGFNGLFRKFDKAVVTSSSNQVLVEAYASSNGNIVVINKSGSTPYSTSFELSGITTKEVKIWVKDNTMSPFAPPKGPVSVDISNGHFMFDLLPYSVTTFVIE